MIAQIKLAVKNGIATVVNIDPNGIENMAGAGFQPTAHWEILTPEDNSVVQDKLENTYGFKLYPPIAYVATREENTNLSAMEQNHQCRLVI